MFASQSFSEVSNIFRRFSLGAYDIKKIILFIYGNKPKKLSTLGTRLFSSRLRVNNLERIEIKVFLGKYFCLVSVSVVCGR